MSNTNSELISIDSLDSLDSLATESKVAKSVLEKQEKTIRNAKMAVSKIEVKDQDTKAKAFETLDKMKSASSYYYDSRMPFTRKLDEIKKLFTSQEKQFGAIIDTLQGKLDAYAQVELQKTREEEEAQKRKIQRAEQKAEIAQKLNSIVVQWVKKIQDMAAAMVAKVETEEDAESVKERLSKAPKWTEKMNEMYYRVLPMYNEEEWKAIADKLKPKLKEEYEKSGLAIFKDLVALVDVRIKNKEEADRLLKSQKEKVEADTNKAEQEAEKQTAAEIALAELDSTPISTKPKVKLKIEILSNEGWLQCISFWYKHDDKSRTANLQRKTFAQCKRFAESMANKEDLLIEHDSVKYVEDVKAKK